MTAMDDRRSMPILREHITGVVLAGGRGSRMGGIDKGLQPFNSLPLAHHALRRLLPQVGSAMLIANRNTAAYETFGAPVWPDAMPDYPGPLAGFLAGLTRSTTSWVLTVPCDTPSFPLDLAARLADAIADNVQAHGTLIAMATDGTHSQPVFCLIHRSLEGSLRDFLAQGGRKVGAWAEQHSVIRVPFDQPDDFINVNSLAELSALETGTAL
jgi:molybdopterin-guanine dinucleotide biosynthesis protein A